MGLDVMGLQAGALPLIRLNQNETIGVNPINSLMCIPMKSQSQGTATENSTMMVGLLVCLESFGTLSLGVNVDELLLFLCDQVCKSSHDEQRACIIEREQSRSIVLNIRRIAQ